MDNLKLTSGSVIHFAGIGGIGMSGLAKMFAENGFMVSGSDRDAARPENQRIIKALENSGIRIFPQDGSFIRSVKPDFMVYSSAVEEGNPDFTAAEIPRIHRSQALAEAIRQMQNCVSVAVSGSAGKTTVTAWLAETMFLCGMAPSCLNGGLLNRFASDSNPGNYIHGSGQYMIFEADESDKSLTAYSPDFALLMNIGTDHYSKEELTAVFGRFIANVKRGLVIEASAYERLKRLIPPHLKVTVFDGGDWELTGYHQTNGKIMISINHLPEFQIPMSGRHNAVNALAIVAMLDMLGLPFEETAAGLTQFQGVWRRFDYAGRMTSGARVYDDYAHNVEKICSCINSAQELTPGGRVFAIFQPHGFGPLGFMRQELLPALERILRQEDRFIFLPPFYAGGTSSFKPTSQEVAAEYSRLGSREYFCYSERDLVRAMLAEEAGGNDLVLIMGARDNSLSSWAKTLTR
ncbi:MAG: hypothetical protein GX280_00115 [Lentisphaerae bacterium]|nr:hypothetical protein [Lentisphaerota bacterium]